MARIEVEIAHELAHARAQKQESKFFESFDDALEKGDLKPEEFSIRRLFENLVLDSHGDACGREILDSWDGHGRGVRLFEATNVVDSSRFSKIFGQIAYTTFIKAYENPAFVFTQLIPTVQSNFEQERIPGVTNLGDVTEEVGESKPYPVAAVSEEWIDTPRTMKRGVITEVTREVIRFDRTGLVLDQLRQVGKSSGINKEKRAIDCVIDENTTKHRYKYKDTVYATYQTSTPWINSKTTTALNDYRSINALELLFRDMRDPYTGEPIMIEPKDLIVAGVNLQHAQRIVGASQVVTNVPGFAVSSNPVQATIGNPASRYRVLSSALLDSRLATDTDWFIGDVASAVMYMENWPIEFSQAAAGAEAEFRRDVVYGFKASDRGAFGYRDPRYLAKAAA